MCSFEALSTPVATFSSLCSLFLEDDLRCFIAETGQDEICPLYSDETTSSLKISLMSSVNFWSSGSVLPFGELREILPAMSCPFESLTKMKELSFSNSFSSVFVFSFVGKPSGRFAIFVDETFSEEICLLDSSTTTSLFRIKAISSSGSLSIALCNFPSFLVLRLELFAGCCVFAVGEAFPHESPPFNSASPRSSLMI